MTAVKFLQEKIKIYLPSIHQKGLEDAFKQAKEMEKQEHGKTWDSAIEQFCKRGGNLSRASCDFDDYYDETYGSKGSETKQ